MVFDFIKANWQIIASIITLIISVIVAIFRKKPVTDLSSDIFTWCMYGVMDAESSNGKGVYKLDRAVSYVLDHMKEKYPDINVENYRKLVILTIEMILSTPEKKGD